MRGIINQFQQNGYAVIEDFFSEKEVEELRKSGEELTKNLPNENERTVFSTTELQQNKDRYFLDSADKISYFFEAGALDADGKLLIEPHLALNKVGHALHVLHPVFRKYTLDERIKETCFQLGLEDPAIVQSMYIFKNPGVGSEVIPHQDGTFLYTEPMNNLVGFWIALEDATIENGCLWFIPGSHRGGIHRRYIRNPDNNSNELLIYTKPAPVYPKSSFTPMPVKKGTCVLIHGQVVHQSEQNKSQFSRHAYTFHVIEQKNATYSSENWLQPTDNQTFLSLYKN